MSTPIGYSLEQARGYSSVAERALSDPLPFDGFDDCRAVPEGLNLLPHQRVGVEWLLKLYYNGFGGVLADEMGLGKTVQIASYFSALTRMRCFGTHLVVAPLVTLDNWEREIRKWFPLAAVVVYHGNKVERESKRRWIMSRQRSAVLDKHLHAQLADTTKGLDVLTARVGSIVITSYEMVMMDNCPLASVPFDSLIVDEAHRLKNTDCKLIRTLRRFKTDTRVLLTGTPLQNNLQELWSIINFVMPSMFTSSESFEVWATEGLDGVTNASDNDHRAGSITSRSARRMQQILRPFVLRRTKTGITSLALPPKYQIILPVHLSQKEREFYDDIRSRSGSANTLRNTLLQLRKACCHPYLFDMENPFTEKFAIQPLGEWCDEDKERYFKSLLLRGSKLAMLHKMLHTLYLNGHRVLIFSQFTTVLDIIEESLYLHNQFEVKQGGGNAYTHCRIDGSYSREERGEMMAAFAGAAGEAPAFCFLISTKSGGVGINLTAADTVIIFDGDFNPQNDYQAIDRCHRIGQTKPVAVYRLVCVGTVEEAMLETALGKVQLDRAIFSGDAFNGTQATTAAEAEDLVSQMTMQYNFGDVTTAALTDDTLALLMDRGHIATNALPSNTTGKRIRFE